MKIDRLSENFIVWLVGQEGVEEPCFDVGCCVCNSRFYPDSLTKFQSDWFQCKKG